MPGDGVYAFFKDLYLNILKNYLLTNNKPL